ncbi:hypothetical protein WICPIJ_001002 [Wickerhamomyces pijperi]|uniref:Uncharacterized protein n=1 Tax=Wickerhamomyces pijperi TaxID=599730 RepID=A0A9P8TQB3_WICPI|nr:hypothetical protein WICPIJ_001002 [Wickerhamomyces pijperi]
MLIFFIIIFIVLLVIAPIVLPVLNGLGSYKVQIKPKQPIRSTDSSKKSSSGYGYTSPEDLANQEAEEKRKNSKLQKLKNGLNVTRDDMPLKFRLRSDENGTAKNVRRRKLLTTAQMNDPNTFDYDLEEFENDSDEEKVNEEMKHNAERGDAYLEEIA